MRRLAAILLMLFCLTAAGLAEGTVCVSALDCAALLAVDGREIISPGTYADIFPVSGAELFAVGKQTDNGLRYALCDDRGNMLTDWSYSMFQQAGGIILFRQGYLYGAMTADGKLLLPADYTQLTTADGEHFLAMTGDPYDNEPDEIYVLTPDGEMFPTGVRSDVGLGGLSEDRLLYRDSMTDRYGYLDGRGNIAIDAYFDAADTFEGGLARASQNGMLGAIDADGEWKILPEYDFLEIQSGVAVGVKERSLCVVFGTDNCEERFRIEGEDLYASVVGGFPVLMERDCLRVYSPEGEVLLEAAPDASIAAGTDGQLIISDGHWGSDCVSLVTADGMRLERRDQHLIALTENRYAFVEMNAAAYHSDVLGEIRYSCDYDSMRWGMMDGAGEEILPAEYLEIRYLGENRLLTVAEDGMRLIDPDGNVLWEMINGE